MGMAAGLLGTGASMASTIMQADAQKKAQEQQKRNNENAMMTRMLLRHQEMMRQNALRGQAIGAFRDNIHDTAGGLAQAGQQMKEQQRLEGDYARGTSASALPASDASIQAGSQAGALAGQSGGDGEFRSDLARRLNNAAGDARNRIAALATMNSYGDSQNGLSNFVPRGFQQAGWDINRANNFRRGSLAAFQTELEQLGNPMQVSYRKPAGATALEGVGGLLGGLGKGGGGGGGIF